MILLEDRGNAVTPGHLIAIFGTGLLGGGILRALNSARPSMTVAIPLLDWRDPSEQTRQLADIERLIISRAQARRPGAEQAVPVRILWTAGGAGFSASEEQVSAEFRSFAAVVATAERLASALPHADVGFFAISSAGGLFEGQRLVDQESRPEPRRPYGRLKASQEQILLDGSERFAKRIYRISSVYGRIDPQHRMGLIPTLLHDGLRRRVSTIVGSASTLRDFVWLDDIGRFLAAELLGSRRQGEPVISYLCSGRSTSLGEVLHEVENTLGRKLYVEFSADRANAADITFSPRLLPSGWTQTDLRVNILDIYRHAITYGIASPPR